MKVKRSINLQDSTPYWKWYNTNSKETVRSWVCILILRPETGLEPGTLCFNACTWTHLSSCYKIQRNCGEGQRPIWVLSLAQRDAGAGGCLVFTPLLCPPVSGQPEPWWSLTLPPRTATAIPLLLLQVHEQPLGLCAAVSSPRVLRLHASDENWKQKC